MNDLTIPIGCLVTLLAAIGCDVKRLRRIKFAGLTLDGVKVGRFRALTKSEVSTLKKIGELS